MRRRMAGAAIGAVFGATLCWTGMISPDVIRDALLFHDPYLFLFFGSAVATAAVGTRLLRRVRSRALLVDAPLHWSPERVERRHVAGALIFGTGWGVAEACPGPVLAQVGQGIGWGAITLAGVVAGVWLHLRQGAAETEPATQAASTKVPPARSEALA
ncbi:MAG: uncharacterized protein QOE06_1170 [Thermoleophilaceae bacterium]|nr:uncharacterized protein [Thermoleophilaceae bacterium]